VNLHLERQKQHDARHDEGLLNGTIHFLQLEFVVRGLRNVAGSLQQETPQPLVSAEATAASLLTWRSSPRS
jgi:hypothetical protein